MNNSTDEIEDSSAPLIEHLAELRTRLIRSVVALLIGICVLFIPLQGDFLAEHVLRFLLVPIEETLRALGDPAPTLQYTSPQEYLFVLFRISMVFGFALAFPVIAHQMWRFVAPGLYKSEKSAFLPFIHDDYAQQAFAEAKITAGLGNPERWYSLLPPAQYPPDL